MIAWFFLIVITVFACVGVVHFLFGCGRKFKNGRKCGMWSCPNQEHCVYFRED